MSLLLQISDPHFGTEQTPVVEALVALARAQPPDVLVLSGDITQRATARQFRAARDFVQRLAVPSVLVLPGNHDIPLLDLPARLFQPYARFQHVFGPMLEPQLETADLLVIGVNTTRAWRHKDGEVSAAQIEQVAQRLRCARAEQLRIVVTHQPTHVYRERDRHNLLHGHERAVHAWAEAGADLVMGGHIHLPYTRSLRDRHQGLARDLWCVQAGTAVSSRIRREAANSVNLLHYDAAASPRRCQVERWDYTVVGRFERIETTTIPLDRSAPAT